MLEAALRFLEPRQRSIGEVRRRLTRVGYRAELVEGAIARLVELGMLDDQAFARTWIESRDRARPRSGRALRRELAVKGVDRETVEGTMDERDAETPNADAEAAMRLLERNARALARVPDPGRGDSGPTRSSLAMASTRRRRPPLQERSPDATEATEALAPEPTDDG